MQQAGTPRYRAQRVAETIQTQGRTIAWLARQLGVSRQYTSDVVHGRRLVGQAFAERVAALLGLPFSFAFDVSYGELSPSSGELK